MPKHYDDGKNAPRVSDITRQQAGAAGVEFIKVGSNCFLAFFRKKVGDGYYKFGIFSLVLMVTLIPASPVMAFFAPLWLVFLLAGGVDRGEHSRSGGWSRLGFFGQKAARFIEPLPVFALGMACAPLDEVFATFALCGATCMMMLALYEWQQINRYKRMMRDARQEMAHASYLQREGY